MAYYPCLLQLSSERMETESELIRDLAELIVGDESQREIVLHY